LEEKLNCSTLEKQRAIFLFLGDAIFGLRKGVHIKHYQEKIKKAEEYQLRKGPKRGVSWDLFRRVLAAKSCLKVCGPDEGYGSEKPDAGFSIGGIEKDGNERGPEEESHDEELLEALRDFYRWIGQSHRF